jgi:hypothetical protein
MNGTMTQCVLDLVALATEEVALTGHDRMIVGVTTT